MGTDGVDRSHWVERGSLGRPKGNLRFGGQTARRAWILGCRVCRLTVSPWAPEDKWAQQGHCSCQAQHSAIFWVPQSCCAVLLCSQEN